MGLGFVVVNQVRKGKGEVSGFRAIFGIWCGVSVVGGWVGMLFGFFRFCFGFGFYRFLVVSFCFLFLRPQV